MPCNLQNRHKHEYLNTAVGTSTGPATPAYSTCCIFGLPILSFHPSHLRWGRH
ncbi:unnamed protein product [Ectocarpus sp. CCAP 1310/34]|nr:unnamed protein product [Ectocarpus sp. CCAP 1310/34]